MRKIAGGMFLLATLAISLLAVPLGADESAAPKRTVIASKYDVSKEVTIEGTVETLVTKPAPGMMVGAHLIVSTPQGTVDAHIGNRVITGPNAASFASGQAVKLVGIMSEFNKQNVFIVRTIETENRTIAVRNEHGFLVPPGSRVNQASVSSAGGVQ
jgi:hypothetical protein